MHKPFKCDICKKRYTRKDNMRDHILEVHANKKKKCDFCGEKMRSTSLHRHVKMCCKKNLKKKNKKNIKSNQSNQSEESKVVENVAVVTESEENNQRTEPIPMSDSTYEIWELDPFMSLSTEENDCNFDINQFLLFN